MSALIEAVPNFSEGRDAAVIQKLQAAADSVPGAVLLDTHADPDHHRTVLTIAGAPEAVAEAAFRAVACAVEVIDMRQHEGVHPRLGAADVVPFVPLTGATMEACVALARRLAERLATELSLPTYLYGEAATAPERSRLPWLRQPQFEGLAAALASAERAPDFGPAQPHPSAGATVVGARDFLLAFNVDLASGDLKLARRIARAIRTSSGGLPGVQAKGLALHHQGRVQVSMNLNDLDVTGPGRVHAEIRRLAAGAGVEVGHSELVGLMPRQALREAAETLLRLREPLAGRVLEDRLEAAGLPDPAGPLPAYLTALAGTAHDDPGGGSAAALALALGTACLQKAIGLSRGGKGELSDADLDALQARLASVEALLGLAQADHLAFAALMNAWRFPQADPQRKTAIATARAAAVSTPEAILAQAVTLAEAAAEVATRGNQNLVNDAAAAAELALAAARTARLNARSNQTKRTRRDYAEDLARLDQAAAAARQAGG